MAPDLENSPILLENMNFEVFSKFIISEKQNKSRGQQQNERRKTRRLNQNGDSEEEQDNVQQEGIKIKFVYLLTYQKFTQMIMNFANYG